ANSWRIGKPTLLSSLAKVRLGSVVSIVAPAGYGKTTALQAWQENADLRAIGVRLGPEHNDEAALALHLIDALGGLVPTVRDVMGGGRPGDADWGRALLRSLSQTYLVLMLDDVHQLTDPGALRLVKQLVVHTPRRMVLAVSGRNHPYVGLARARVEGRLLALTGEDLVLSWRRCGAGSSARSRSTRCTTPPGDGPPRCRGPSPRRRVTPRRRRSGSPCADSSTRRSGGPSISRSSTTSRTPHSWRR
ncbi:AAA family ATPase, partial [Micropruina sp.]|uniref:AAA family ATPase n=1 Tax=Micropruina sp. TaxID=2737536 RepID=UPI00261F7AE6